MKHTLRIKLLALGLFLSLSGFAQNGATHEFGVLGGAGYYLGDINPYSHYRRAKAAFMLLHRYNWNQRFTLKSRIAYTNLEAYDSDSRFDFNQNRNLHFKSSVIEVGADVELNYFDYAIGERYGKPVSPYLFFGISIYRFNPKAELNGNWIELQSLGTEGQGMEGKGRKYGLTKIAFPFGAGLKCDLGKKASIGFEWGLRKTFTDYIDDVSTTYVASDDLAAANGTLAATLANRSLDEDGQAYTIDGAQRGNSNTKDWYVVSGVYITFKISKKNACPKALN